MEGKFKNQRKSCRPPKVEIKPREWLASTQLKFDGY